MKDIYSQEIITFVTSKYHQLDDNDLITEMLDTAWVAGDKDYNNAIKRAIENCQPVQLANALYRYITAFVAQYGAFANDCIIDNFIERATFAVYYNN